MEEPTWLSRRIVDALHHQMVEEHGGLHGVRDDGLVESAIAHPRNRWGYAQGEVDLAEMAAACACGLTKNHGYVDGNKRVGFMAAYVFLDLNGLEIDAPEPEVVELMEGVAKRGVSEPELAGWLRAHTRPL